MSFDLIIQKWFDEDLEAPVAGGQSYTVSALDGVYFGDVRFNNQQARATEAFYFVDIQYDARDIIVVDGMLSADSRYSDLQALDGEGLYLADVRSSDLQALDGEGLYLADARYSAQGVLFSESTYLLDATFLGRDTLGSDPLLLQDTHWRELEATLRDALLLADTLSTVTTAIQEYLRAAMDGLLVPDVGIRVGEFGQLEMFLLGDSVYRDVSLTALDTVPTSDSIVGREYGIVPAQDSLYLADLFARAQELGILDKLLYADSVLAEVTLAGAVTWVVTISDGLQFQDPSYSDSQHTQQTPLALPDYANMDRVLVYLEKLLLGDVISTAADVIATVTSMDGLYLLDARQSDVLLSLMTRVLLASVPVLGTDLVLRDGVLLDEARYSETERAQLEAILLNTSALLRELNKSSDFSDGLLLGDVAAIIVAGIRTVLSQDSLLVDDVRSSDLQAVDGEGLQLADARSSELEAIDAEGLNLADARYAAVDLTNADALLLSSARSSELLFGMLIFLLLDDASATRRVLAEYERSGLDKVLLAETFVEALKIINYLTQQLSVDNLMLSDGSRADLMKQVVTALLLDSVKGTALELDRSQPVDKVMFSDYAARSADLMRSDSVMLADVMLSMREAMWQEGLVFTDAVEKQWIGVVIAHLVYARIGINANFLGAVLDARPFAEFLEVVFDARPCEDFLGVVVGTSKWRVAA